MSAERALYRKVPKLCALLSSAVEALCLLARACLPACLCLRRFDTFFEHMSLLLCNE